MSNLYALIMAGGSGTRLWPLSRQQRPKQALTLIGERTMFQHAVDRLDGLLPRQQIFVVTAAEYVETLAEQVPGIPIQNFVVEPMARGTAGAVGLAALHLRQHDPDGVMAVLTADHYIRDVDRFRRALSAAHEVADQGHIVTLGIQPSFPSTGFGYIRRCESKTTVQGSEVFEVEAFVEKPDLEHAIEFVTSGLYSWNSGMFIWQTGRLLAEFARHMPDFYAQLEALQEALDASCYQDVLSDVWPKVRKETIDYGIMEKAKDVKVIPVDIGWTDIGDWQAVYDLQAPPENGNAVIGAQFIGIDTAGCLIRSNQKLIATLGLNDTIIIDTEDAILICARDQAQNVRAIVDELKSEGKEQYL